MNRHSNLWNSFEINRRATLAQIVCKELDNCEVVNSSSITKIMIPFDNSKHASNAFGLALTLAKKFGASITMISVIQEDISRNWVSGTPAREKGMSESSTNIIKENMKASATQAKKFGVQFDSEMITSPGVADSLISFISARKIDFVIMGTRGNGMAKEMMLGRVSTSVALNANCPVLLVK